MKSFASSSEQDGSESGVSFSAQEEYDDETSEEEAEKFHDKVQFLRNTVCFLFLTLVFVLSACVIVWLWATG